MSSISNTGPLSPLSPRQGLSPIRLPQSARLAGADSAQVSGRTPTDSFQAPHGLAATAGGISALERSVNSARSRVDDLDRVGALLEELQGLVGDVGRRESDAGLAEIQSRIDAIIGTISDASAQAVAGREPFNAALPLGYSLFRNESITTGASGFATFAPGQEAFGLDVVVTTSAQQAGFLLSFGGTNLNLGGSLGADGADRLFAIELSGQKGLQEITFASGTTVQDVAWGINYFAAATGVTASLGANGTSLLLRSDEYGADAFTSVRINDDGMINDARAWAGIYQLKSDNTNALAPGNAGRILFSAASNTTTDHGQDVQATIGGVQATTKGLNIRAATDNWRVSIDLAANFAAGVRQATPAAWFFPNPAPDGEAATDSPRQAEEFIPGAGRFAAELRNAASARLTELTASLRESLGTPQPTDEKQVHLETLAAFRRSLLGEP